MRHWFGRKNDRVQGGLVEGREIGANTKKPPVFSEGVGDTYGCTRKGMGGRGGEYGKNGKI